MKILYEDGKYTIEEDDDYYILYTDVDFPDYGSVRNTEEKSILGLVKLCKKAGLI